MKLKHLWAPLAGAIAITIAGATPAFAIDPSPAVMDMTGTPELGPSMTVAFKTGQNPAGDYFDIWMCPNKNVLPVDFGDTGDCVSTTFWLRSAVNGFPGGAPQTVALSMKWLLANETVPGLIPSNDQPYLDSSSQQINVNPPSLDQGGWCAFEGWYIIINDFNAGGGLGPRGGNGHSNWSEPFSSVGCSASPNTLPDTGASTTTALVAGSLGLAAIAGGLLLVRARRLRANGN
jgi:hypothetical protein